MSLKKRAIGSVVVAGSLVITGAIADTAGWILTNPSAVVEEAAGNHTAGMTAGVIAQLKAAALEEIEDQPVGIERNGSVLVTAAPGHSEEQLVLLAIEDQSEQALRNVPPENAETAALQPQAGAMADLQSGLDASQEAMAELQNGLSASQGATPQAGAMAELQAGLDASQDVTPQAGADVPQDAVPQAGVSAELQSDLNMPADAEPQTEGTEEQPEQNLTEDAAKWQNRLMADVQDFLYVREAGDENASIIGKLYKGDVAEVVEPGETWTHVVSGNVDGYVLNSYCLFGTDAMNYAMENFDTKAEIMTNGLRVRRSADTEGAVMAAVSTGTYLIVDTDAEVVDGWVAVSYGGETGYVSAEYVTTELALGEGITIAEEKAAAAKAAEQAAAAKAAQVSSPGTVQNAAVAASVDDVTLLAALIQCEAGNEPYEGQLAVGAVVMNRVRSGAYPGSVYGVIYQSGQFSPAGSGSVAAVAANGPKASCVQAAQEALNGMDNTGGAIRFQRASGGHAGVVIGNHVFF